MAKKLKQAKEQTGSIIRWRFLLLCGCILLAILGLNLRLAYLQIIKTDKLVQEGDLRSLRVQTMPSPRGMITDRAGRPLAVSVPVNAIWADPKELSEKGGITSNPRWKALSDALELPIPKLIERINSHPKARFVYLARQISPDIGHYIQKLKLPGIYLRQESRRYYPAGQTTAHIIGVTNIDGQGIEGAEKSFNTLLMGQPGQRVVRKDRDGRVINTFSGRLYLADHLVLSIDEKLHRQVFHELNQSVIDHKAESGTAVLLDVNTGEVLAMANSPSYNPNNLMDTPQKSMRNRAITDIFEPGSTVKPMVVMAALQHRVIEKDSVLNTTPYYINGHKIQDISFYPKLSITEILQKSSNVGVSKLALAMPPLRVAEIYSKFGLGKPTLLGLVGESKGLYSQKKTLVRFRQSHFFFWLWIDGHTTTTGASVCHYWEHGDLSPIIYYEG